MASLSKDSSISFRVNPFILEERAAAFIDDLTIFIGMDKITLTKYISLSEK